MPQRLLPIPTATLFLAVSLPQDNSDSFLTGHNPQSCPSLQSPLSFTCQSKL